MTNRLGAAFLFLVTANAQLRTPVLGHTVTARGEMRPLLGIPGALVMGPEELTGVRAFACDNTTCLAKTERHIVTASATFDAPSGPAVIALDGERALLYFPETRSLALVVRGTVEYKPWTIPGEVLALRLTVAGFEAATRDSAGVRIVREDGAVLRVFAAGSAAEFFPGGVAYTLGGRLYLHWDSGKITTFALPGIASFFHPADDYLGIRITGGTFLLRTRDNHEELWQLPEVPE